MAMENSQESQVSIYDQVAFPSYPYPQSHPERLATMARLCGLSVAPLDACRVLELGCGAGGNLLPMADSMPHSQFVGIDLSPQQIQIGCEHIRASGLTNVRLEARNILSLDAGLGSFDFVIAHGVFSWTTAEVREHILKLCRVVLSPVGVAYINYNTYPGWHMQGMLRDMLSFHAQCAEAPEDRVREARRMIDFLDQTLPGPTTAFGSLVRSELDAIRKNSDAFLFHAYLNVVNQPFYLSEFQRLATVHNLRYLGDADPELTWPERTAPQLATHVKHLTADESRWCQHVDFIRFTNSRRSLLCQQNAAMERGPCLSALPEMHVSAAVRRPESGGPTSAAQFVMRSGRTVSTNDPRMRLTMESLADAWPESIPVEQLSQRLDAQLPDSRLQQDRWQQDLLHGFCNQVLGLSIRSNRCSRTVADKPLASPLARLQAAQQDFVANLRHEVVRLSDMDRRCLTLLDGSRTVQQIADQLGNDARESLSRLSASSLLIKV